MEMHRTYCHGAEKSFKSPNVQDLTKFDETIQQIERQHNESSSSLDRKKRQRVKELVENFHQDPGSLSEALEKEFGFKNVE